MTTWQAPAGTVEQARDRDFFGHPRGLAYLAATEAFERFSYYGMQALLVLYISGRLLKPGVGAHVLGFDSFVGGLRAVFGPLSANGLAAQIFGLYTGVVYLAPILGGIVGDRVLGRRRTIILGLVLMAIGHFLMAAESLFLPALATLLLGGGCLKGNIAAQVGALYLPGDPRRTHAFSIFYMAINLGGFLSPLVCGTLGELYGWHYGFGAAGVVMVIGLITYLTTLGALPADPPLGGPREAAPRQGLRRLAALAILILAASLFWTTTSQGWNTYSLWVRDHLDRRLLGLTIPVTWFQSVDTLGPILFPPALLWLWSTQAARGREMPDIAKLPLGCMIVALGELSLSLGIVLAGAAKVSLAVVLGYSLFSSVGYLYFAPVVASMFSRAFQGAGNSTALSVYFLSIFAGSFASGWLARFYDTLNGAVFWAIHAGICVAAAALLLATQGFVTRALEPG